MLAHMHASMRSLLLEMQDNHLSNKELFVWILFPGLEAFIYKWLVQLMSNTLVNCTSEVWTKTHTARYNFQRPLLLSFWSVDWLVLMAFLSASDHCLPHSPSAVCLAIKAEWTPLHVSVSTRVFEFLNIKFKHSLGMWYPLLTKKTNTLEFCFSERPRVRQKQHWRLALILCPPKSGRAALLALKVLRGFLSRFPGRASPGAQMSDWVWEHTGTTSLWLVLISVINTSETAPPHFQWLQVPGVNC